MTNNQMKHTMGFDEITPHLNKIATLYLINKKRKVGWILIDPMQNGSSPMDQVFFISMQKGKQYIKALESNDMKTLEPYCEVIQVTMIERIRSSK